MTIDEIAKIANVSKTAVSFALNDKPGISEKTKSYILDIAAQHGYVPKTINRKKKDVRYIKFLYFKTPNFSKEKSFSSTFFSELIRSIELQCKEYGYSLIISAMDIDSLDDDLGKLQNSSDCSGTIVLGTNLEKNQILMVASKLTNYIFIDNPAQILNVNSVAINNIQGAFTAVSHLIEQGFKRLGYVRAGDRIENFELRHQGFVLCAKHHNIDNIKEYSVGTSVEEASADFLALLDGQKDDLPDAIFCESDYIAIGVIKALKKKGYSIPDDVAVIGFDNVPEGLIVSPELSTVRVHKEELGRLTVEHLHRIMNKKTRSTVNILINTDLVLRKSCP